MAFLGAAWLEVAVIESIRERTDEVCFMYA